MKSLRRLHTVLTRVLPVLLLLSCLVTNASAADPALTVQSPPKEAKVFFVEPTADSTVTSPVKVVMGVEGMSVKKAGELEKDTGHHHIIINKGHITKGSVVPADAHHIHYGGGQTEAELELPKGKHTLTLQFADGLHRSYGEQLSASIHITVQ